jgi:hypothetical protein
VDRAPHEATPQLLRCSMQRVALGHGR